MDETLFFFITQAVLKINECEAVFNNKKKKNEQLISF